jgi:hypothetical protein
MNSKFIQISCLLTQRVIENQSCRLFLMKLRCSHNILCRPRRVEPREERYSLNIQERAGRSTHSPVAFPLAIAAKNKNINLVGRAANAQPNYSQAENLIYPQGSFWRLLSHLEKSIFQRRADREMDCVAH